MKADARGTRHMVMADLARLLAERDTIDEASLLESVTASAVENVPGTDFCGITLVDKKTFSSVAPSDPIAARIDELQNTTGEGPCLEAAWANHMVRVPDYRTETRWPTFVAAVLTQTTLRSTLAFQLCRSENTMGAINLHSATPDAFTVESEEIGLAYATHAALALFATRRDQQFASALASRDTIGQAKGIVMERFDIDALQAWELIRKLSQDANIRVADLAQQLIDADHPARSAGPVTRR